MNYADFGLGTWQPKNGFYDVVKSMIIIAKEQGVKLNKNSNVDKINIDSGSVKSITVNGKKIDCDFLVSGIDYAHTESLIDKNSDNIQIVTGTKEFGLLFIVILYWNKKIEKFKSPQPFFDQVLKNIQ